MIGFLDPLTGLPTLDALADRITRRQQDAPGVLLVRLLVDEHDRLARDYGHGARADVLCAIADRLHLHTQPRGGTPARLGAAEAAEFAVVLPLPAGALTYPIAWARHQLAVLRTRVTIPGHPIGEQLVAVTAAAGAALTIGARDGLTALLHAAGQARDAARAGGDPLSLLLPHHLLAPAAYAAAGAEPVLED